MSDCGFTDIRLHGTEVDSSRRTDPGESPASDYGIAGKAVELSVTKNNPALKSTGERKARERTMKIARGHQMFKNIELVLSDAQMERRTIEQERKEQQYESRLEVKKTASPARLSCLEAHRPFSSSSLLTVDELIHLFDLAVSDQRTMNEKLKRALNDGNLTLSAEEWNQFACHVADVGVHEARGAAINTAVTAVGYKSFRSAFAQEINILVSNYVLFERKGEEGIIEFLALLLVANWPREHAQSDLESNEILFCIISSIKGWLITIAGEADEIDEVESSCACALYEVCRFAQRKLWMKWPELVDECYAAVKDAITSNITLTKSRYHYREARKALLDTMIMMHEWSGRNAKTLVNASTQTTQRTWDSKYNDDVLLVVSLDYSRKIDIYSHVVPKYRLQCDPPDTSIPAGYIGGKALIVLSGVFSLILIGKRYRVVQTGQQ